MNATEYKATWGDGPWVSEPDRKEWKDPATGYPCIAHRNMMLGQWCGYVAVPPGHPAHRKGDDELDVNVHGGLTYADVCAGDICHVPEPGEPDDVWWLGFDCGHAYDICPSIAVLCINVPRPTYDPAFRRSWFKGAPIHKDTKSEPKEHTVVYRETEDSLDKTVEYIANQNDHQDGQQ